MHRIVTGRNSFLPLEETDETFSGLSSYHTGSVANWVDWAKDKGLTYAQLREANPWIRSTKLSNSAGKTYTVRIPKQNDLYRSKRSYTVYNKIIRYNGDNTIKIYLGDFSTSVTIVGCEPGEPDFTYVSTAECNSNGYDISIETAIPRILDTDVTVAKKISKAKLKHLYRILGTKTDSYLGFSFGFENNDHEQYLPLAIRLKLPADFKPEYTELYYSPNNKTILGCMNKMAVNEDTLQITIFKAGTYMLVYDPDKYAVEETPEEEEEEEEED